MALLKSGMKIQPTKSTPEIILNPGGVISIRGRSMNGDINEFYDQIDSWINHYLCNPAEITLIEFRFEYFNKLNLKVYNSIIRKIETLAGKNKKFLINWYYEEGDEDILEKGEYFSSFLNIPFNFIEICDSLLPGYLPVDLNTNPGQL
jgi:SiaC family regulatory phosphoprotein